MPYQEGSLETARLNPGTDALQQRTGELIHERADLAARIRTIDMDVATLKRAAEILSPGTTAPAVSKAPRKNGGNHAGLASAMLDVLRDAPAPLTAAEVGVMAMELIGQDPGSLPRSVLTTKATTAMRRYHQLKLARFDGVLVGFGGYGWASATSVAAAAAS